MNILKEEKEKSIYFLSFLLSKKKPLMIALLLGILAGVALYKSQDKKYRSTAIIYAGNSNNRAKLINNPQFGYETETEQLMQLLESKTIRDSLIKEFDLISHYNINKDDKTWKEQITIRMINDIEYFRSKYLSVVINVTTTDPKLSADIANYVIQLVDRRRKIIFNENISNELNYLNARKDKQKAIWDDIKTQIYEIKDPSDPKNIVDNYLEDRNPEYISSSKLADLVTDYEIQKNKYYTYKDEYDQSLAMSKRPFLKNYVIDRAVPSYKPVFPSLIFNIGICIMISLTITFISLGLIDQWKKIS